MRTGEVVLIPFPFAELTNVKARPSVIIAETDDRYKDIIVAAITSVVPSQIGKHEVMLEPSVRNGLRVRSVLKVDRLVTTKRKNIIVKLGTLSPEDIEKCIAIFQALPQGE
jgi:mRNA interferase MazF